jgi:hypothetical protein
MPIRIRSFLQVAALLACSTAGAQDLLNVVNTVAAPTVGVPVEETFDITIAGQYDIVLTDLGAQLPTPAPLASVGLAVTQGATVIGTPLTAPGTLTINATPGTYVVRVTGTPGSTSGSGPFSIVVNSGSGSASIYSFVDALVLPRQALPSSEAVLDYGFSITAAGEYNFTLADLQFTQALNPLTAILIETSGAIAPVVLTTTAGGPLSVTQKVALPAGAYTVFAVGKSPDVNPTGLFSVTLAAASGGAPVVDQVVPVGLATTLGFVTLSAGQQELALADLAFPTALAKKGAVLVANGVVVATATGAAPGYVKFTAQAGTYRVCGFGIAAPSSAGSYVVAVGPQGGNSAFTAFQPVTDSAFAGSGYVFPTTITSAGNYQLSLTDFAFPLALQSIDLAVAQGTATVGKPLTAATVSPASASLAVGPAAVLVFAQAATAQGTKQGGIFGVELTAPGAGTATLSATQGVGTIFTAYQIAVPTASRQQVSLTDLQFPAPFANLDGIVTSGTQLVGAIYGSSAFIFSATPGNYFINLVAQADPVAQAGTYAAVVAPAPPAPAVTLSASASSVTSGNTVTLTWSSQNATGCTASGAWSGTQATSGSVASAALVASSTFTLTCTGAGGSTAQSVTVGITAPSSSGGGLFDWLTAIVLAAALQLRWALAKPADR